MRNDDRMHRSRGPAQPNIDITPDAAAALTALGRLFKGEIPDVDVGQLWRAEWDSVTILGVTLATEDGYTEFAPITVDVDFADPYTAILQVAQSPLPVAIAVFTSLATPVPVYVLEASLGQLAPGVVESLTSIWRDSLAGRTPKSSLTLGRSSVDPLEVRSAFRHELADQLTVLASAELIRGAVFDGGLSALSSESTIPPSRIHEILGVGLRDARAISVGHMPLTETQAKQLAEAVGVCEPEVLRLKAFTVPRELVEALYSPRRFSVVRRISRRRSIECVDAIGYVPSAVAARTQQRDANAPQTRQYWIDLLERLAVADADASP